MTLIGNKNNLHFSLLKLYFCLNPLRCPIDIELFFVRGFLYFGTLCDFITKEGHLVHMRDKNLNISKTDCSQ